MKCLKSDDKKFQKPQMDIVQYKPITINLINYAEPLKMKLTNHEIHSPIEIKKLTTDNLNYLFQNIKVFLPEQFGFASSSIKTFRPKPATDPLDRLVKNIGLFRRSKIMNELGSEYKYTLIINDQVGFDYLPYYKHSIFKLIRNCDFDIVELTIMDSLFSFENLIQEDIHIKPLNNFQFFAYIITEQGLDKLLLNDENQDELLKDCNVGFLTRPLFYSHTHTSLVRNFWYSFYRVTSMWDKVYCINLGFELLKRVYMKPLGNIVNCLQGEFFHNGILGVNLPSIETLIKYNIFHPIIQKRHPNMGRGAIGLNVTQRSIINECVQAGYERVLIFEDDVTLPLDYFKMLDILFSKEPNIDILYLGYSNNESSTVLDVVDTIYGYDVLKPKDICKKVCIGGFFGVMLSKKALEIYKTKMNPIQDISDILLCDLSFNIDLQFDGTMKKMNHNLNVYFIQQLCKVDTSKPSLTEENNFNLIEHYRYNREIQYLSKIKKIQYLVENNFCIKIYTSSTFNTYYKKFLELLYRLFPNHINNHNASNCDIALYTVEDNIDVDNKILNVIINGEKELKKGNYDIGILTTFDKSYPINIYFPFMWISLWERRQDYKSIQCNTREKFCAYMYNYDVEYRVKLFKLITNYKKVDALGKSQNNVQEQNDRSTYNNNVTYNDLAVQKYSNYKFVLALENGICPGYITEKIINPILAGSIPIYAGPNDIFYIINKKRMIYVGDYEANELGLVEEVKRLDNDSQSYLEKVNEPIFVGNVNFDTFEKHLLDLLQPAFGFIPKTISFLQEQKADLKIKDILIKNYDKARLNRYLSDFMLPGDQIQ
jgi:hypothetical protein